MRQQFFLFTTLLSLFFNTAQAQEQKTNDLSLAAYSDSLQTLALEFLTNREVKERQSACESFLPLFQEALKQADAFNYPFDSLTGISKLYAPDSTFRLFTWQLYNDVDDYRYFGLIQKSDPAADFIILNDQSSEAEDPAFDLLGADNWYGVVYYKIKDFDTPEGKKYLLFGKDGFNLFNRRKVMDVLSFKENEVEFGADIFAKIEEGKRPRTQSRVLLEYSAEISITLNYDETRDMVIFDHLISSHGTYRGQGPVMVTDGSYEGYQFDKGLWVHIDKVFDQVSEEAPREQPILDSRTKDVFGRGN